MRRVATPLAGDQIPGAAQPVTADERWYAGSGVVERCTSSGPAPAGEVPVVIGAAVDASAAALTRAMRGQQSHVVRAWDSREGEEKAMPFLDVHDDAQLAQLVRLYFAAHPRELARLVPSAVITQRVAQVAARRISQAVSFSCMSIESVLDDH